MFLWPCILATMNRWKLVKTCPEQSVNFTILGYTWHILTSFVFCCCDQDPGRICDSDMFLWKTVSLARGVIIVTSTKAQISWIFVNIWKSRIIFTTFRAKCFGKTVKSLHAPTGSRTRPSGSAIIAYTLGLRGNSPKASTTNSKSHKSKIQKTYIDTRKIKENQVSRCVKMCQVKLVSMQIRTTRIQCIHVSHSLTIQDCERITTTSSYMQLHVADRFSEVTWLTWLKLS